MIRLEHVNKSFGNARVLRDVSLDVGAGEVVCVIGPSGAGKSTMLRCINHLERIDSGRAGGRSMSMASRSIAIFAMGNLSWILIAVSSRCDHESAWFFNLSTCSHTSRC